MIYRKRLVRMNAPRKPVSKITDRAKRYRANADDVRPAPPKQCGFCGKRRNVGVHHISGIEDEGDGANLMWACKSCNGLVANVTKRAGLGRRTIQFNPRTKALKGDMAQYAAAIKVMRGDFPGNVAAAMKTIHDTPASVRSAYTARTWPIRRSRYGQTGRQSEIPF